MQMTTEAFGQRLQVAVASHPQAPVSPFGRQRWLLDRLAKEAGLRVSANTVHKWFNGMSRPREDNIQKIAHVLSVDEVWLALGRIPTPESKANVEEAAKASGGVLVLAGMIELLGGKVTFAPQDEPGVSLWANIGNKRIGLTVAMMTQREGKVSFIVPEPASDKIVGLAVGPARGCQATGCLDILDLTNADRQNHGGFSIISGELRDNGKIKVEGQRNLLSPLSDMKCLAE